MLDIAFIRENKEVVGKSIAAKGMGPDIEALLKLDVERRELLAQVEALRQQRNQLTAQAKGKKPSAADIKKGQELKAKLARLEKSYETAAAKYTESHEQVPNIIPDDTPLGGEDANREEKQWGDTTDKKFEVVDHLTWGETNDAVDFERGAKVAGSKFYFLKGHLVELQFALIQWALTKAIEAGFTPMTVPHLVNSRVAHGTGYLPRGEERQIYKIEDHDLNLIATSEIPLTGYHSDEILPVESLPLCYVGVSPSYRVEAGAYGKPSKGLYRVHQFDKVELYVFCAPENSEDWHQKLLAFEEELCQLLEIPYRVVRIAAGDLGAAAYKKYDIEYWSPVEKAYRELMSCSNVTDYQARRLSIRVRGATGEPSLVHTLNGTAMAFSRTAIALIENRQQANGHVTVPEVLKPLVGFSEL